MKKTSLVSCILLASLLTAGMLSACGSTDAGSQSTDSSAQTPADTETSAAEDKTEQDSIPALDFNGAHLRMAGQAYHITNDMDYL